MSHVLLLPLATHPLTLSRVICLRYTRINKPPRAELYDAVARYPQSLLSLTPCDIADAYMWHLAATLHDVLRNRGGVMPLPRPQPA